MPVVRAWSRWRFFVWTSCLFAGACGRIGVEILDAPERQHAPVSDGASGTTGAEDAGTELDAPSSDPSTDASPTPSPDAAPEATAPEAALLEASSDASPGCAADADGDAVCDATDNCRGTPNPKQEDADRDGIGDACEGDRDGDGVPDDTDPCPDDKPDDSDGDGVCDSVDKCAGGDDRVDSDGDGSADHCDMCPNDANKTAPGVCGCGVTAPAGLVGYWSFDATSGLVAADGAGAHPGALTNMVGNEWTAARVGNGLGLDGVNDYVSVGAIAGGVRALSFWMKADSFGITTDQTGWRSPTTTGMPNNRWTNPTRAYVKDGSSATTSTLIGSNAQDWGGFGIAIPSTTTGIEAKLDMPGGTGLLTNTQVDFSWNAGASYSSACTSAALLNLGADTFSCASSLWGHNPWTASELSDANFRVRVRYGGLLSSISLDLLQVNVHYAPYTEPRNVLQLNASAQVEFSGQSVRLVGFPAGSTLYVDKVVGSAVDTAFHHVAIVSPSAIDASAFQIGRAASDPLPFDGVLDEVKLFTQPLSASDVNTLFSVPACR